MLLKYGVFAYVTFQDLGRENIERTEVYRDPVKSLLGVCSDITFGA